MAESHFSPDDDRPQKRVQVGEITTTHGVKGLVKLRVLAEDETLLSGDLFTSENGSETLHITLKNRMNKVWLAEVEGYTDKTAAEALRGTTLYLDRSALPEPDEDEYYYTDLIGMDVVDTGGQPIGKVIGLENFGASDLLDIKPKSGPSFYLPFTDEFVPEIGASTITVIIPEGLLE